jgi:ParB family chromosome partitioning protein
MPDKDRIRNISLDQIERNPNQPRETFPEDHIARLADSIKTRGLIQPITVRPIGRRKTGYIIVAGECRYRAHVLLGVKTIPAIVVSMDDQEMQLRAIVENLQRRDMNPMEEAKAFATLINCGMTKPDISKQLGVGVDRIQNRLNLLDLLPQIQHLVATDNLSTSMASAIALAPSEQQQLRLVREIDSGRLRTVDQIRHAAQALRDAALQTDAFGGAPKASRDDIASVNRLETKIETIAQMISAGFKDGECVAAQRVSPDRVTLMADKLSLIRKHVLQMEHDLRRVAMQTEIRLEAAE